MTLINRSKVSLRIIALSLIHILIVTTATNITALGLVDAVNYFYNRSNDEKVQKAYINTIMGFQTITGIAAGILIVVLSNNLVAVSYTHLDVYKRQPPVPILIGIRRRHI